MNLLGVEDRVLDRFLASVNPADADGMRRHPPLRRDQFDNFVFEATRWVVGEADMASFGYACQRYRYANNDNDITALLRAVPLIPPGGIGNAVTQETTDAARIAIEGLTAALPF